MTPDLPIALLVILVLDPSSRDWSTPSSVEEGWCRSRCSLPPSQGESRGAVRYQQARQRGRHQQRRNPVRETDRGTWRLALPSAGAALLGSWFGAKSVSHFSPELVRPLVLILLVSVAIYTFMRKDFGKLARPSPHTHRVQVAIICAIGLALGFYDGFFGPGTGSFLIFLFIRFLGQDFLQASVTAKIRTWRPTSPRSPFRRPRLGAVARGGVMASCNLAGAVVGTRLAVARGTGFVRKLFLFVVTALILKLAYDILGA